MYPSVIDLFCGGGLASRGLLNAGLNPFLGIDSDEKAAISYRKNFVAVCQSRVDQLDLLNRTADVVWMSPPCTMFSSARGARPKDEAVASLVYPAMELALTAEPKVIAIENHRKMYETAAYRKTLELAATAGYSEVWRQELCASSFGSASRRERTFAILVHKSVKLPDGFSWQPVASRAPEKWTDLIDWDHNFVRDLRESTIKHLPIIMGEYETRGIDLPAMYAYYGNARCIGKGDIFRTLTCRQRELLIREDWKYRMIRWQESARMMGVPDGHVFVGSTADKFRMIGNGVHVYVAEAIGKRIRAALTGREWA